MTTALDIATTVQFLQLKIQSARHEGKLTHNNPKYVD